MHIRRGRNSTLEEQLWSLIFGYARIATINPRVCFNFVEESGAMTSDAAFDLADKKQLIEVSLEHHLWSMGSIHV
jgi:hypothetical protein